MTERLLTIDEIMKILRTTVPRLAQLTDGVPRAQLRVAPDDGWSVNDGSPTCARATTSSAAPSCGSFARTAQRGSE